MGIQLLHQFMDIPGPFAPGAYFLPFILKKVHFVHQ